MKIGVTLDIAENASTGKTPPYSQIKSFALAAEAGGLDSIWAFDHLLFRFDPEKTTGIWECWSLLCALAEATDKVELGALVLCNPFRNPALLAKMAHTLDEISMGRLILGIGAGWHEPEFDAFGFSFEKRVGRLEEALQILRPLLNGGSVDFVGEHYQARHCEITPAGPRPDGIPLLMGAFQPRMLRLAAQYADMWNTVWLGESDGLAEPLAKIQAACTKAGRDPDTLQTTVGAVLNFPDLADIPPSDTLALSGSPAELAGSFHRYQEAGCTHLILRMTPATEEALARVVEAVGIYRG